MRISIKVDDKNVRRRIKNVEKQLSKSGKKDLPMVMRWARDKIIRSMPKKTGYTARAVGITKEVHSKGKDELVVGLRYAPYGEKRSRTSWDTSSYDNLADFMMRSPRAFNLFKSGNIPLMRNVPIEAIEKFKKRVKTNFKNI